MTTAVAASPTETTAVLGAVETLTRATESRNADVEAILLKHGMAVDGSIAKRLSLTDAKVAALWPGPLVHRFLKSLSSDVRSQLEQAFTPVIFLLQRIEGRAATLMQTPRGGGTVKAPSKQHPNRYRYNRSVLPPFGHGRGHGPGHGLGHHTPWRPDSPPSKRGRGRVRMRVSLPVSQAQSGGSSAAGWPSIKQASFSHGAAAARDDAITADLDQYEYRQEEVAQLQEFCAALSAFTSDQPSQVATTLEEFARRILQLHSSRICASRVQVKQTLSHTLVSVGK